MFLLFISAACGAAACGPSFPNDYYVVGGGDPAVMPEASFTHEVCRLLGMEEKEKIIAAEPDTEGAEAGEEEKEEEEEEEKYKERAQLKNALVALGVRGGEASQILDAHQQMRAEMRERGEQINNWHREMTERKRYESYGITDNSPAPEEPKPYDLTPHAALLSMLPAEFSLYARGAAAYHNRQYEQAAPFFEQVLALPEEARTMRGIWAAHMLGMTRLRLEQYDAARTAFELVKSMAIAGAADPLGLAPAATGWLGRVFYKKGETAAAARTYLDFFKIGDEEQKSSALQSLETVFKSTDFASDTIKAEAFMQDGLLRSVMIAWFLDHAPQGEFTTGWLLPRLAAMAASGPVPHADRIAWLAYDSGKMEEAEKWAAMADQEQPMTLWVQSKLLRRAGKMEEAAAVMQKVVDLLKNGGEETRYWTIRRSSEGWHSMTPVEAAAAELGALRMETGDLRGALGAFVSAGFGTDAAYVAEHRMPLDDLLKHVSDLGAATARKTGPYDQTFDLHHLLARRLARAGRLPEALQFYPEPLREPVKRLTELLLDGRAPGYDARKRAGMLMEAARIVREQGMEIYGTELCPDWFVWRGDFEWPDHPWCAETDATPNKRFHYRYLAAGLMWEAAGLLPDNDPMTAEALHTGGMWLKNRDPEAADPFYKSLVRRNRRLEIARQADELRWFPREFTDKPAPPPPPPPFLQRKRAKVLGAVLVLTAITGAAVMVRRKKSGPGTEGT